MASWHGQGRVLRERNWQGQRPWGKTMRAHSENSGNGFPLGLCLEGEQMVLEGSLWALQGEPAMGGTDVRGGRAWLQVAFKVSAVRGFL